MGASLNQVQFLPMRDRKESPMFILTIILINQNQVPPSRAHSGLALITYL